MKAQELLSGIKRVMVAIDSSQLGSQGADLITFDGDYVIFIGDEGRFRRIEMSLMER